MAQPVTNLTFSAKFSMDSDIKYRKGKLFLGVLGIEYSVPYWNYLDQGVHVFEMNVLQQSNSVPPSSLQYNFINRTQDTDEFAYSDGVLPIYLRFQPDLQEALNDAAMKVPSGADYMAQALKLEQPEVHIEGVQAKNHPDGSTTFPLVTVVLTIPVNPPSIRNVELSLQKGLIVWLGKAR